MLVALRIEVVLISIWIWLSLSEGHSGFMLGGLLQFPGAIVGITAVEAFPDKEGYLPIIFCFLTTFISQLMTFILVIELIHKLKDGSKL